MSAFSRRGTLGKRARRSTAAEQQVLAEPPRTSKRLREKREASQTNLEFSTINICNGLATPEPSSLSKSQTSLSDNESPAAPKDIFPFMQLPAELRIHIYHMALHRDDPLYLHTARAPEKGIEDASITLDTDSQPLGSQTTSQSLGSQTTSQPLGSRIDLSTRARRPNALIQRPDIPPPFDCIVPTILRLNQQIYKEARSVLYSANTFTLSLVSGIHTLSTLHQRSRSLIKHVVLTIPSHHDILDGFADLVRLGLRYCWGLTTFKIILQASLPDDGRMTVTHATSVYANAFHILRWLPRGCKVLLEGNVSELVREVVREEGRLQSVLDEVGYAKRQHQMPERH